MNINIILDGSVKNAPAAFVADVNYVAGFLDSLFNSTATINIAVGWGEIAGHALGSGDLSQSQVNTYASVSYAAVQAALAAENAPGAATLPAASPLAGDLLMGSAQAKALGLIGASSTIDGYIGLNSGVTYGYGVGVAPAAGQYYLIGALEHEITEVMGRFSLIADQPTDYTLMDLFRYSAPGVRSLGSGGKAYFSTDGGVTDTGDWNTSTFNGDLGDWYPAGAGASAPDAFNDIAATGKLNAFSQSDITLMRAIGWSTAPFVTGVVVSSATTGVQAAGASLTITLNLNEAVTVTGAPSLTLNDGGTAVYLGGSGSTALTFGYTVAATDQVVQSLAVQGVALNGGVIGSATDGAADFVLGGVPQTGPAVDPSGLGVTVQNFSLYESQALSAAGLTSSLANPAGDTISLYAFMDTGSAKSGLTLNGVAVADGQWVQVAPAALGTVKYQAAATPGSETLEVKVYDATLGRWSTYSTCTATTLAPATLSTTAAWVSANLDALQAQCAAGGLASITLTDTTTPKLSISAAQMAADAGALGKIKNAYWITASGVIGAATAVGIPVALRGKLSGGLAVSDSTVAVAANLTGLQAMAKAGQLASIAFTDGGSPVLHITAATLTADGAALAVITGPYGLVVTGTLSAAVATKLPATLTAHLTVGLAVADTAANVLAALAKLQTLATAGGLASISLTNAATPTLTLTTAQLKADVGALSDIVSAYAVSASGASKTFTGLSIGHFTAAGSVLDLTDLNSKTLSATFTENALGTAGTLNVSDGKNSASITLFGQFMAANATGTAAAAGIVAVSDGSSGTRLTYNAALALPH